MCGFFGIVSTDREGPNEQELNHGLSSVLHRGPDGRGIHIQDHIGFAHARLSIFDPSKQGDQPFRYENISIVFNGAIYNFREIRAALSHLGYSFRSESDTEVICAAFKEWGADCVHHFNGMWAFAIYDAQAQSIFCSRDRFGIKPFYYVKHRNRVYFSSEIKSLTGINGFSISMNQPAVSRYLTSGELCYDHDCLVDGILSLKPGHSLLIDQEGHIEVKQYYDLEDKINAPEVNIDFNEATLEFRQLFENAIQLRMRSDVPYGAALSGGLDSSSIVSMIRTIKPEQNLETISVCFDEVKYNEQSYIHDTVSRHNLNSHKIFPKGTDLIQELERLSWYHDQAIPSASVVAQNAIFQKAKSLNLKVMLDGQGADEILYGYDSFYKDLINRNPLTAVLRFPLLFAMLRNRQKNESRYLGILKNKHGTEELRFEGLKQKALHLIEKSVLPSLLHFEDRNSMMHGVESRVPFLDHRLVEFAIKLPITFFFHKDHRKFILKESMKDLIPSSIYKRKDKMAFATPQQKWMRINEKACQLEMNRLKPFLRDLVEVDRLDQIPIEAKLYWRLLSLGIWRARFEIT